MLNKPLSLYLSTLVYHPLHIFKTWWLFEQKLWKTWTHGTN